MLPEGNPQHILNCCWFNSKMNKNNNARNRQSITAIQRAYMHLVVSRDDISSITVSDICKKAGINRTTFYAHYLDISDLKEAIYEWMLKEFLNVFKEETSTLQHSYDFGKLFRHISENQLFYRIYFKLGFDFKNLFIEHGAARVASQFYPDTSHLDYHIEFFAAGITAIIRKWLDSGCQESPDTIGRILREEYQKNNRI